MNGTNYMHHSRGPTEATYHDGRWLVFCNKCDETLATRPTQEADALRLALGHWATFHPMTEQ